MTQQELDFTRAEQLSLLRRLPPAIPADTGDVSKRSIVAVIKTIDEYANSQSGWCWASQQTIATAACIGERTVRRAMAWMDASGLIATRSRGNGMTKMTKIVWGTLGDLIQDSIPESAESDRPVATPDRPVATPDRPVATPDRPVETADRPVATPDRPVETADRPVATPDRPVLTGISEQYPVQSEQNYPKDPVCVVQKEMNRVLVDALRVRAIAESLRKACRCGPKIIPTDTIWKAAMLAAATDWDALPVARFVGAGSAGNPKAYFAGAIEIARNERGGITPVMAETEAVK